MGQLGTADAPGSASYGKEVRRPLEFMESGIRSTPTVTTNATLAAPSQLGTDQFDIGGADRARPHHPCRTRKANQCASAKPIVIPPDECDHVGPCHGSLWNHDQRSHQTSFRFGALVKPSLRSAHPCSPIPNTGAAPSPAAMDHRRLGHNASS